jgi:hypothetical protein
VTSAVRFGKSSHVTESEFQNVDVSLELDHSGVNLTSAQSKAVDHPQRDGFKIKQTVPCSRQDSGDLDVERSPVGIDSRAKAARDQARKKLSSHRCEAARKPLYEQPR